MDYEPLVEDNQEPIKKLSSRFEYGSSGQELRYFDSEKWRNRFSNSSGYNKRFLLEFIDVQTQNIINQKCYLVRLESRDYKEHCKVINLNDNLDQYELIPKNIHKILIPPIIYNTTAHFIQGSELDTSEFMANRKDSNPLIILPLNQCILDNNALKDIFRRTNLKPIVDKYYKDSTNDILYSSNVQIFRANRCKGYKLSKAPSDIAVACVKTFEISSNDRNNSLSKSKIKLIRQLFIDLFKIANLKGHDTVVISGECIVSNKWNSQQIAQIIKEVALMETCNAKHIIFTPIDKEQHIALDKGITLRNKKCCIM